MFHIYDGKYRITSNPISYNHLIKHILNNKSKVDYNKLSSLPISDCYYYLTLKIVRVS